MKKLFVLAGAALLFASCGGSADKGAKDTVATQAFMAASTATVNKSLNGIDEAKALQMIANFEQTMGTHTPSIVSYFLNKDMLTKMIKLMESEIVSGAPHNPDGIRIYLGRETLTDPKLQLIIVSTVDSVDQFTNRKGKHHDYYTHDGSHALFGSSTDRKIPFLARGADPGTRLYTACGNCDAEEADCDYPNDPHLLTIKQSEGMVARFGNHKINTRAEWFALNRIKALVSGADFTGVRVYMGTHPSTHSRYANRDAFVLTITKKGPGNVNRDYYGCKELNEYFRTHPIAKQDTSMVPGGEDNGELCPDNCN